jgi:hypothetical protein
MNIRLRKNVAKAMVKKRGTTAIAKRALKKRLFTDPSAIHDEQLKERFDKSKSWMTNLKETDLKEMYEERLPEIIAEKAAWTIPKLSENEAEVVRKLITAHGADEFHRMAFDRKLNKLQWTEEQCEKKVRMLIVDNRVHTCEEGRCLCGSLRVSSNVTPKNRARH